MTDDSDAQLAAYAAEDVEDAKTSFVLALPHDLPPLDAVTLASAKGLVITVRDVRTIRSVAKAAGLAQEHDDLGDLDDDGEGVGTSVAVHLTVFAAINIFLGAVNLATSASYLWFLWVAGPWSLGLFFHYMGSQALRGSSQRRRRALQRTLQKKALRERNRPERTSRKRLPKPRPEHRKALQAANPRPEVDDESATRVRAPTDSDSGAPTNWESELPAESAREGGGLRPGQRLADRFVIERPLGKGGMGEVFVARDEVLGEDVALKTISASLFGEQAVARFLREAQASRRITHPNVIRIHDIGRDDKLSFISMEYVKGDTLGQYINEELQLDYEELTRIALQLCDGLAAAHDVGVVHRDLKPENVLLDEGGQVRIIDFGLAKLQAAEGLTATGAVMGTPEYMAPEQMLGQPVDVRTDVYALGCILYHALAGVPPFRRDSAVALGVAHVHDDPPPLLDYRPGLPKAWDEVVTRALRKPPAERFQNVADLRAAIAAIGPGPQD